MIKFENWQQYQEYIAHIRDTNHVFTQEEIDELSPDNIDNTEFWREAVEKFGGNPYCNAVQGNEPLDAVAVRNTNTMLSIGTGVLNDFRVGLGLSKQMPTHVRVLEIGGGLGPLYQELSLYCHTYKVKLDYLNIDVYKHPDSIIPIGKTWEFDGKDFDSLPQRDFDFVYSSNVWQHLSNRQRTKYLGYISKVCKFRLTLSFPSDYNMLQNGPEGSYCLHYGQLTRYPNFAATNLCLEQIFGFAVTSTYLRADGYVTLNAIKRKDNDVNEPASTNN